MKNKGKEVLKILRERGILTNKEAFEKYYKKVEKRLKKEVEELKKENNDSLKNNNLFLL